MKTGGEYCGRISAIRMRGGASDFVGQGSGSTKATGGAATANRGIAFGNTG